MMKQGGKEMQNSESQNLESFQKSLQKILQASDYNLNPFIDGGEFDSRNLEVDDNILDEFFGLVSQIVLDNGKEYFSQLIQDNSRYENCEDFFLWLYEYAKTVSDVYQMTKKIKELDLKEFEQLFDYCLEKLILHNIGLEMALNERRGEELYNKDNLKVMAGLISMYYELIFIKETSRDEADYHMYYRIGIPKDKCSLFWEKYLKNEGLLWKKYSLKLQNEINNKLELFIKIISTVDEDEINIQSENKAF